MGDRGVVEDGNEVECRNNSHGQSIAEATAAGRVAKRR